MKLSFSRFLALMLCVLLLALPFLAACEEASEETSSAGSSASGATSVPSGAVDVDDPYLDADGRYTLEKLERPEFNFTEKEFRVCVYNNVVQNTYFSEEIGCDLYETTDDAINEGVRTRNDLVEEQYGVKVVAYAVEDVGAIVKQSISSGDDMFDAAMPFMNWCTGLAQDGCLWDLKTFEQDGYLHLEAPWWDQDANKMLSIAGRLYFTTGDISFMQKVVSGAFAFNKKLYADFCADQYGDLYQMVRDGKWTVDVMQEMAKSVAADIDGEPGMSYKDRWGLIGSNSVPSSLLLCSGETLVDKDQSDCPILVFGENESGVRYAQKLLELFTDASSEWFLNVQTNESVQGRDIWQTTVDVFGENRSLFYSTAFSGVKKLRNYPNMDPFGMVPVPKRDEDQDQYYSLSGTYAYGVCIPKCVKNPEFSAYMLDVLACGGKNYVTPAYYEIALKLRDSSDEESAEMLDNYIFKHLVYDLGAFYDFGGISSMMTTLMASGSADVSSKLEEIHDGVLQAIEKCVDAYRLDE